MSENLPKRLMFRANGDANSYSIIDASSNNWLMCVLLNGEHTTARQAEILERMAACWTACDGMDTDLLDNITMLGETLAGRFKLRDQIERDLTAQRDELLSALNGLLNALPSATTHPAIKAAKAAISNATKEAV